MRILLYYVWMFLDGYAVYCKLVAIYRISEYVTIAIIFVYRY